MTGIADLWNRTFTDGGVDSTQIPRFDDQNKLTKSMKDIISGR